MGRLEGKVTLVVGGGTGIGKAIALAYAIEGAVVSVAGRSITKLEQTVSEIGKLGHEGTAVRADVAILSDIDRLVDSVVGSHGRLDVLVNSAGDFLNPSIAETSEEDWDRVMNVQLKGVFFTIRRAAREMTRQQGGSIINLASVLGVRGKAGSCVYCTAKGGIINMTRALAVELGPHNVRVNAIAPGFTLDPADVRIDPRVAQSYASNLPVRRLGAPQEITGAALYLASSESSFTTGTTIFVDGGECAQ
jgi:NAD(P)-dependent dehydrogenase (short-subunit alcohol dehydrogenase family)